MDLILTNFYVFSQSNKYYYEFFTVKKFKWFLTIFLFYDKIKTNSLDFKGYLKCATLKLYKIVRTD